MVSKQPRNKAESITFQRLRALNENTGGIALHAFSGLADMAPKVDGQPRVIGPYDTIHEEEDALETFRAIGYRKTNRDRYPPIAHAKLALLGTINWTDEHPAGGVGDYYWFQPRRLWVSSANFTHQSRKSIEFGYWTEERDLMVAVEHFLVALIGASEDLDAAADTMDPEMVRVEFDDQAMAEAAAELYYDSDDEE